MSKALITLRETNWSGWDGGHLSTASAQVWAEEKTVLSPETMGHSKADYGELESLFYEVAVDRIVQDMVAFAYRKLVVDNPGGSVNLTAPPFGEFSLRWGETKKLSTPTMDGGTGVAITVDEIR